jgi:hypothetical protein
LPVLLSGVVTVMLLTTPPNTVLLTLAILAAKLTLLDCNELICPVCMLMVVVCPLMLELNEFMLVSCVAALDCKLEILLCKLAMVLLVTKLTKSLNTEYVATPSTFDDVPIVTTGKITLELSEPIFGN